MREARGQAVGLSGGAEYQVDQMDQDRQEERP